MSVECQWKEELARMHAEAEAEFQKTRENIVVIMGYKPGEGFILVPFIRIHFPPITSVEERNLIDS